MYIIHYLKVSIRAKTLMQKLNDILFIFIKSCYKKTKLSIIQYYAIVMVKQFYPEDGHFIV